MDLGLLTGSPLRPSKPSLPLSPCRITQNISAFFFLRLFPFQGLPQPNSCKCSIQEERHKYTLYLLTTIALLTLKESQRCNFKKYKFGRQQKRVNAFLSVSPEDTEWDTALALKHPKSRKDKSNRTEFCSLYRHFSDYNSVLCHLNYKYMSSTMLYTGLLYRKCFSSYIW